MVGRILVVDDNLTNLKLLAVLLRSVGHEVSTAQHADEALVVLGSGRTDLVLMDLQMPGMDGLALTARIRAAPETSHLKIVAVTAYAMKGDDVRALAAGCDRYVSKPINTSALLKLVAELLGGGA